MACLSSPLYVRRALAADGRFWATDITSTFDSYLNDLMSLYLVVSLTPGPRILIVS